MSSPLQQTQNLELISLSLLGFKYTVKICCMFDMDLERKAFITTFSKFTFLTSLAELKAKNIESIRTLLEIALEEGNLLGESWREVVLCISQLERIRLFEGDGEQEMQRIQRFALNLAYWLGLLLMNRADIIGRQVLGARLMLLLTLLRVRVLQLRSIGCLLVVLH